MHSQSGDAAGKPGEYPYKAAVRLKGMTVKAMYRLQTGRIQTPLTQC